MTRDLQIYYLITTHNHERFIGAALQSLFAAHEDWFNSPLGKHARILVLDDASSDQTWNKLRHYQATQGQAMMLAQNRVNSGLIGLNRNILLDLLFQLEPAEQDLVMFLDGDDLLPTDHLQSRLRVFGSDPALDCVGGQLELFYDNGRQSQLIDTFSIDRETAEIANLFECHYYISNVIFKARALRRRRFPEIASSEDWLFFAASQMQRQHCAESTLRYRRHTSNLTSLSRSSPSCTQQGRESQMAARTLGLARIGYTPSAADHQLLAQIGYHSFRIRWANQQYVPAPTISMPWFDWIGKHDACVHDGEQINTRISHLFDRMSAANLGSGYFSPDKLDRFLTAMQHAVAIELSTASCIEAAPP